MPESGTTAWELNARSYPSPEIQQKSFNQSVGYRQLPDPPFSWNWQQNQKRLRTDKTPVAVVKTPIANVNLGNSDMGVTTDLRVKDGTAVPTSTYSPALHIGEQGRRRQWMDPAKFVSDLGHESVHLSQYGSIRPSPIPESILTSILSTDAKADPARELEAQMQQLKARIYKRGKDPYSEDGAQELRQMLDPSQQGRGYLQRMSREQVDKELQFLLHVMRGVSSTQKYDRYRGYV